MADRRGRSSGGTGCGSTLAAVASTFCHGYSSASCDGVRLQVGMAAAARQCGVWGSSRRAGAFSFFFKQESPQVYPHPTPSS